MLLTAAQPVTGAMVAAAGVILLLLVLAEPVRRLERFVVRKAAGLTRDDVRSGRWRIVRDWRTGALVAIPGDDVSALLNGGRR